MDVEKTIEFLLNNQAKHDVWHAQANERLTRLEAVTERLADNVERLDETMLLLAESGIAAQKRIDKLVETIDKFGVRMDQFGARMDQLVGAVGVIATRLPPPPAG